METLIKTHYKKPSDVKKDLQKGKICRLAVVDDIETYLMNDVLDDYLTLTYGLALYDKWFFKQYGHFPTSIFPEGMILADWELDEEVGNRG